MNKNQLFVVVLFRFIYVSLHDIYLHSRTRSLRHQSLAVYLDGLSQDIKTKAQCLSNRCFCRGFLLVPIGVWYGIVESRLASVCACLHMMSPQLAPCLHAHICQRYERKTQVSHIHIFEGRSCRYRNWSEFSAEFSGGLGVVEDEGTGLYGLQVGLASVSSHKLFEGLLATCSRCVF